MIEKLRALPQPEVSFNYLGQFDAVLSGASLFALARETYGPTRSSKGSRNHLITVNGIIREGRLQVDWTYCENLHRRSTIEGLAHGFVEALRSLIAHCQSPNAGGYTPSDFPKARLSQEELDRLIARIGPAGGRQSQ
jgi:non-ribosomal peptide synthase protein (TIGR01720 family)